MQSNGQIVEEQAKEEAQLKQTCPKLTKMLNPVLASEVLFLILNLMLLFYT